MKNFKTQQKISKRNKKFQSVTKNFSERKGKSPINCHSERSEESQSSHSALSQAISAHRPAKTGGAQRRNSTVILSEAKNLDRIQKYFKNINEFKK